MQHRATKAIVRANDQSIKKINIDFDLKVMSPNQSLAKLTSTLVQKLDNLIKDISPDLVICHGDTTTSLCAGISSFYNNVPVAHVEAGQELKQ